MTNIMFLDVAVRKTQLTFMPNPIAFVPDAHAFANWMLSKSVGRNKHRASKLVTVSVRHKTGLVVVRASKEAGKLAGRRASDRKQAGRQATRMQIVKALGKLA